MNMNMIQTGYNIIPKINKFKITFKLYKIIQIHKWKILKKKQQKNLK